MSHTRAVGNQLGNDVHLRHPRVLLFVIVDESGFRCQDGNQSRFARSSLRDIWKRKQ